MKNRLEEITRSLSAWIPLAVLLSVLISAACGSESPSAERERAPDEEKATAFELPEARGGMMSLSQILEGREAAALVFYRGFF